MQQLPPISPITIFPSYKKFVNINNTHKKKLRKRKNTQSHYLSKWVSKLINSIRHDEIMNEEKKIWKCSSHDWKIAPNYT